MRTFMTTTILTLSLLASPAMAVPGKNPSDDSIVAIATSPALADTFSTLVGLVVKAGLDGVLATEGQFTVFAPTNDAFGATADEIEAYLELVCDTDDATGAITNVLLHHVTDGRRFSNSLLGKKSPKPVEMLNGYIWINGDAMIMDGAGNGGTSIMVAEGLFNISASNGVIHVTDSVLFPDNVCE